MARRGFRPTIDPVPEFRTEEEQQEIIEDERRIGELLDLDRLMTSVFTRLSLFRVISKLSGDPPDPLTWGFIYRGVHHSMDANYPDKFKSFVNGLYLYERSVLALKDRAELRRRGLVEKSMCQDICLVM